MISIYILLQVRTIIVNNSRHKLLFKGHVFLMYIHILNKTNNKYKFQNNYYSTFLYPFTRNIRMVISDNFIQLKSYFYILKNLHNEFKRHVF